ncbi:MAG: SpoIIE family protein phosphatase [Prevotella sp.]|nr:SpoIIE family protein phosphatase [Prevotella sp.]
MRYRYLPILAALFLVISMAVQFVMSYRQAARNVQENIDLKTQIAHEKILFELYDAYDVVDQMKHFVADNVAQPDNILKGTRDLLKRYPSCYTVGVSFPENFYPAKGKWFSPCSYRLNDSIISTVTGGTDFDYFQREWYKGALKSGNKGYWGKPYWSHIIDKTIFTYSDNFVDNAGNPICVVNVDFSLEWMQQLLEQFKLIDEAVCVIYSSDGTVLTSSDNQTGYDTAHLNENDWIVSRQTFEWIDIEMVIAVPQWLVWKSILWRILWSLVVLVLSILVVGVLIRRMLRDQQEKARLETEKKVMDLELHIANGIQMGILRHDFPQDDDMTVYADLLPMREVGGDLYDFSRQGDVLWFIIGDVSGKGIPATMFMSAAVNLFRSALGHQTSPKAIIEEMNAVLSDNNPTLTFVTAFIGRLHIPSGQLLFCNAAHMPPMVKSSDNSVRLINMIPNIPLGYEKTFKFVEEGCMLDMDEKLVLYTDGVTEARDTERKMMGEPKWLDIVSHDDDLLEAVKRYIGEAEPTDDITLMTIRKKSAAQPVSVRVPNHIEQWPSLRRTLHEYGVCVGIEKHTLKKLEIALEEAVVNVISYSHATEMELKIQRSSLNVQRPALNVTLTDNGVPFDPTSSECDTAKVIEERQIGGLGISLLRQITDEQHYQRTDEKNQLTIIKYLSTT